MELCLIEPDNNKAFFYSLVVSEQVLRYTRMIAWLIYYSQNANVFLYNPEIKAAAGESSPVTVRQSKGHLCLLLSCLCV